MAGFAAGGCEPVFDAVDDDADEAVDDVVPSVEEDVAPDAVGSPVIGLMPGGVSDSGVGAALCPRDGAPDPDDGPNPLRRASGRRFMFVDTYPVVPAPEPGAVA